MNTNYSGKAQAAIDEFKKGADFVFIHVEAPDECSHNGDLDGKLKSIEYIDEKVFKPVLQYLRSAKEPYRILVVSDHKTPVETRNHNGEPVPFVLFDSESNMPPEGWKTFTESAAERGMFFESGCDLADYFFKT